MPTRLKNTPPPRVTPVKSPTATRRPTDAPAANPGPEPTIVPTRTPAPTKRQDGLPPTRDSHAATDSRTKAMNTTFTDLGASLLRGQQSDIGKRPNQEDRWEIREFQTADGRPATLAMIADGIGGHNTGEIASQMAKEMIPARLTADPPSASEITRRLKAALEEAGQAIYNASLEDPDRSGMGTTCTAIVVADRRLYLAHVGDSRAYLLRGGQLRQLTIDHTWAEEAIRAGRSPEEIRNHPNRGVIMRYLGIDPTVNIDSRYRGAAGEIVDMLQAGPLFLEPGDTLMLCSDGVSDSLDARQVADLLAYPDCQTAADALVSGALKAGATDNVTALVLRLPGGVVAPPAALAPAGKKRPWLLIVLAALALVAVGAVARAGAVEPGRTPAAPLPSPSVSACAQRTADHPSHGAPVRGHRRRGSAGGDAGGDTGADGVVTVAPTLPVISATAAVPERLPSPRPEPSPVVHLRRVNPPSSLPTPWRRPERPTRPPRRPLRRRRARLHAEPARQHQRRRGAVAPARRGKNRRCGHVRLAGPAGFRAQAGRKVRVDRLGWDEEPMRDGRSPVGGTVLTTVQANLTGVEDALRLTAGQDLLLGRAAAVGAAETPLRMLSDGRKFAYDRPSSGGGGS